MWRRRDRMPDAVIVLGASVRADGRPSPALRRRVRRGVEVFRRSGAKAIIMTGGPAGAQPSEATVMRLLALAAGVPDTRILVEADSSTTLENAVRSAALMRRNGWRRAIVVSDRVHLPRGLISFLGTGIGVLGHGIARAWRSNPFPTAAHYLVYEAAALGWYLVLLALGRGPRYTDPAGE